MLVAVVGCCLWLQAEGQLEGQVYGTWHPTLAAYARKCHMCVALSIEMHQKVQKGPLSTATSQSFTLHSSLVEQHMTYTTVCTDVGAAANMPARVRPMHISLIETKPVARPQHGTTIRLTGYNQPS